MGITFAEIDDDCNLCPLHKEGMCNGMANYGGEPVFPPCAEMDENTDVEEYVRRLEIAHYQRSEQQREKERQAAEEKAKKDLKKKRRQFSDSYCREEINRIKDLKKMLKRLEDARRDAVIDSKFLTAMMQMEMPVGDPEKADDRVGQIDNKIKEVKNLLDKAREDLLIKRKEVQKMEAYKSIK